MKYILFIAFIGCSNFLVYSQVDIQRKKSWSKEFNSILTQESDSTALYFRKDKNIDPSTIFKTYKKEFALSQDDEMTLSRKEIDLIGQTHHRYSQKYKGIVIEGAEYIIHEKNNIAVKGNGKIITINKQHIANIKIEDAEKTVFLQYKNSTLMSNTILVYTKISDDLELSQENICLSYKVEILNSILHTRNFVYVNATTGNVFKTSTLTHESVDSDCEPEGTCLTMYNGYHTFGTGYRAPWYTSNYYLLEDKCRGNGMRTSKDGDVPEDADNHWELESERPMTSAHWAAQKTWDFYSNTYGRYGSDNNSKGLDIKIISNWANANATNNGGYNDRDQLNFGTGDANNTAFVSLDIVGHEFTHLVTGNTSKLVYAYESGALNESFSDIFGTMVEFSIEGNNGDWLHGEDKSATKRRSLINPKNYGQPDTYKGINWTYDGGDYGGVHTNSGVQNKWFYLLSQGGSGTNDKGEIYNVIGIGRDKAAKIAYLNLTGYLTSTSVYNDARNGSIMAARDLFGDCSNEMIQTANAWYAVGVGSASNFYNVTVCGNIYDTRLKSAINSLVAGTSNTCSNTRIYANADVVFKSSNTILLNPGFEAQVGSKFQAVISNCAVTTYTRLDNSLTDSNKNFEPQISNLIEIINPYPNPISEGKLNFGKLAGSYTLFNSQGVLVSEGVNVDGINVDNLEKGIYLLIVDNNTSKISIQ